MPLASRIRMAVSKDNHPWQETTPVPEIPTDKEKHILIVDDNADFRETLTMLLEMLGYRVWSVSTGRAVLSTVTEIGPDVLLLDIGLPGLDGIEVARQLANLPCRAAMKLIGVSGYSQGIARMHDNGDLFDAYLLKPTTLEYLLQVLG